MYSDENKASSLAKLLIGFDLVMLDTCSLMEDSFPEWLDVLKEAKDYLNQKFTLVVPKACYSELRKHSISRDVEKRITSKRALKILKLAKHDKLVSIGKRNYNKNFADNAIYSQASQERIDHKVLVITQDKKLATDLRNLNKLASQKGRNVAVYKVVPGAKLEYNQGETFQKSNNWKEERHPSDHKPFKPKTSVNNGINDAKESANLSPEAKVIQRDKRLSANLRNPNYSSSEKIADIEKQLELLKTIPEGKLKSLHLLQDPKKLNESLAMLKSKKPSSPAPAPSPVAAPSPAPEKKAQPEPAPEPIKKEETPAVAPSPAPIAKPQPTILVKTPAKKLWYGEGNTLPYALNMVAEHYGLMFRDPSIPYFAMVHGPIDLTTEDQNKILDKFTKGFSSSPKVEFDYSSFHMIGEKGSKGYKVYLDLNPQSSVQPETEEQVKKAEPLKVEPVPKAEKKESAKPVKKPAKEEKKPAKPEDNSKPEVKAVPNSSAAVPGGVTLVVGVPTDERKRGYIERSAKRAASKEDVKPKAKEKAAKLASSAKKKEASPAPAAKKAEKPAPKKQKAVSAPKQGTKPKAKPVQKAEKPVAKPAAKETPKKAAAKPAKAEKAAALTKKPAPQKKTPEANLSDAQKSEKILKANIHNPNYPVANKKKDLEAQISLVKKLSKADQGKLMLNLDALKGMLDLL